MRAHYSRKRDPDATSPVEATCRVLDRTARGQLSYHGSRRFRGWSIGGESMSLLIRRYKLLTGLMREERIDEPERIARYLRLFEKAGVKQDQSGEKLVIAKNDCQLL